MKIDLSGLAQRDRDAIQALADSKDFSVQTLVVQALRLYQDVDHKLNDGEICSWSGDAERARAFMGPPGDLQWDNGAENWDYPLVAIHKTSRSMVLFYAPGCGTMIKPGAGVLTKPGDWGTGYAMDDFTPQEVVIASDAERAFATNLRRVWLLEGLEAMNALVEKTERKRTYRCVE